MDPLSIKTEDNNAPADTSTNGFVQVVSQDQMERLRSLHTTAIFADVNVLLSDGSVLAAHKPILAMASKYAYDALQSDPNTDVLDLTFIQNAEVGKLVLDHFYGTAFVPPKLVPLFDEALEMVGSSKAAPMVPDRTGAGRKRSASVNGVGPAKEGPSNGGSAKDKPQGKKLEQFQESDRKDPEIMKAGEKFACRYCFQPFTRQHGAARHILLHFAASMTTYGCMKCTATFSRQDSLKAHCIKVHNMDKDFATAVIKEMFPNGSPKKNVGSAVKKEEETADANGSPLPSTNGSSQNNNGTPPKAKKAKRSRKNSANGVKQEPADDDE